MKKFSLLLLLAGAVQTAYCLDTDRGMHINRANQVPQKNYVISWGADGEPTDVDILTESNLNSKLAEPLDTLSRAVDRVDRFESDLSQIRRDYAIKTRVACTNDFWNYVYIDTNGIRQVAVKLDKVTRAPAAGADVVYANGYTEGSYIWAYRAGQWVLGKLDRDFTSFLSLNDWLIVTYGPTEKDITSYTQVQHILTRTYEVIQESVTYSNEVATVIRETDENTREFVDSNYVSRYKISSIDRVHPNYWYLLPAVEEGEQQPTNYLKRVGGSTSTTWQDDVYTLTGAYGRGWSLSRENPDGTIDTFSEIFNPDIELTATELDLRTGTIIPVLLTRSSSYAVITNYQAAVYADEQQAKLDSLRSNVRNEARSTYAPKTRVDSVAIYGRELWNLSHTNDTETIHTLTATSFYNDGSPYEWADEEFILTMRNGRPEFTLEKIEMGTKYDAEDNPYEALVTNEVGRAWLKTGKAAEATTIWITTNACKRSSIVGDYKLWRTITTVTNLSEVVYTGDILERENARYEMTFSTPNVSLDNYNGYAISVPSMFYGNAPFYPISLTIHVPNSVHPAMYDGPVKVSLTTDYSRLSLQDCMQSVNAINVCDAIRAGNTEVTFYFDETQRLEIPGAGYPVVMSFVAETNRTTYCVVRMLSTPVDKLDDFRVFTMAGVGYTNVWIPWLDFKLARTRNEVQPFTYGPGLSYDPTTATLDTAASVPHVFIDNANARFSVKYYLEADTTGTNYYLRAKLTPK